jgi:hypothetical protein
MHQAKECVFRRHRLSAISHEIRLYRRAWLDSGLFVGEFQNYINRFIKLLLSFCTVHVTLKITVFVALSPVFKEKND